MLDGAASNLEFSPIDVMNEGQDDRTIGVDDNGMADQLKAKSYNS